MTRRMEKVADLLQSEIAELLRREVKHPALTDLMISITRVEVAPDLGSARIFVSIMEESAVATAPDRDHSADVEKEALEALTRTEPFLHHEMMKRLHMRQVPRMRFIADHSIAEGDRIIHLMREVAESEGRAL